jgi:DNA-binding beta-propeller fold protein YncE
MTGWRKTLTAVMLMAGATAIGLAQHHDSDGAFLPVLPLQVSTIPSNGDTTPYGLAFVPHDFPDDAIISPGELLVSNFNSTTTAGQGTTIVTVDPRSGKTGLFFQGNSPIGFTLALTVARVGLVFAGSLPTSGGTAEPGPLDIFDAKGNLLKQLGSSHLVDGPWGMALNDRGNTAQLFVSNIFDTKDHFAGSITRLDVSLSASGITVLDAITIASGYASAPDTAGTVVGPAGLAYDREDDTLYVAAEGNNAIYKLKGAGTTTKNLGKGQVLFDDQTVLHGPLGLIFAPNGDLITANADPAHFPPTATDPSEIIEITRGGTFVRKFSIDPNPGSAFAVLVKDEDRRFGEDDQRFDNHDRRSEQFIYVDDFVSNCILWK